MQYSLFIPIKNIQYSEFLISEQDFIIYQPNRFLRAEPSSHMISSVKLYSRTAQFLHGFSHYFNRFCRNRKGILKFKSEGTFARYDSNIKS